MSSDAIGFEQYLLKSELAELYNEIKEYSIQSLHLPMSETKTYVGFGKYNDFFMYFIGLRNEQLVFSSRIKYSKVRDENNVVRLQFIKGNRNKIFECINTIYNDFLKSGDVKQTAPDSQLTQPQYHMFNEELILRLQPALDRLEVYINKNGDRKIGYIHDTRVRNLFAKRQINNYGDILEFQAKQIVRWRNCGQKCVETIIAIIEKFIGGCSDIKRGTTEFELFNDKKRRLNLSVKNRMFECYSLSDTDIDNFKSCAERIRLLFDEYTDVKRVSTDNDRNIDIFVEYVTDDESTLEHIGEKYGISRERVRQIAVKQSRFLRKKLDYRNDPVYACEFMRVFNDISDDAFIHFVALGLFDYCGIRLSTFILSCFFVNSDMIIGIAQTLRKEYYAKQEEGAIETATTIDDNRTPRELPATAELIVLTKSYKNGGYCIAGIDCKTKEWIRLVSSEDNLNNEIGQQYIEETQPLDIIQVKLLKYIPYLCHTENYLVDLSIKPIKIGTVDLADIADIMSTECSIFHNKGSFVSEEDIALCKTSLGIFPVENIVFECRYDEFVGSYKYKCSLDYRGEHYSRLSLTDPIYRNLDYDKQVLARAIVVVSLPSIAYSEKYYKFVAKIFQVESDDAWSTLTRNMINSFDTLSTQKCVQALYSLGRGYDPFTNQKLFKYSEQIDRLLHAIAQKAFGSPKATRANTISASNKHSARGIVSSGREQVGKPWTSEEEQQLIAEFNSGLSTAEIAASHLRKSGGIRARLKKLGLID